MKTRMLIMAACVLGFAGCATGLKSLSLLAQTVPYAGDVRVVLDRTEASGTPIFTARYDLIGTFQQGGLWAPLNPNTQQLEEIKTIAASHGADTVAVRCGEPGTTGAGICSLKGYTTRATAPVAASN